MMDFLKKMDNAVAGFCKITCIIMLAALFLLLGMSIILRLVPLFTISGYDEIVELLFIWIVILATVTLWRDGLLYRVAIVEGMLPPRAKFALAVFINLLMFGFAMMLTYYGWLFAAASGETTPFLRLDKTYWYAAIPAGGFLMAIYSLVWLFRIIWLRQDPSQEITLLS